MFVSFSQPDLDLAQWVKEGLENSIPTCPVFFSPETLHDVHYDRFMDRVLESVRCFVAVTPRPEAFEDYWPEYEWRSFHADVLTSQRPEKAALYPILTVLSPGICRSLCEHTRWLRTTGTIRRNRFRGWRAWLEKL